MPEDISIVLEVQVVELGDEISRIMKGGVVRLVKQLTLYELHLS